MKSKVRANKLSTIQLNCDLHATKSTKNTNIIHQKAGLCPLKLQLFQSAAAVNPCMRGNKPQLEIRSHGGVMRI